MDMSPAVYSFSVLITTNRIIIRQASTWFNVKKRLSFGSNFCQEILTKKKFVCQETLIKTLLQHKLPNIKQRIGSNERFGAYEK